MGNWEFIFAFLPKDPLPWANCPLNINHTNYVEECEKASSTQYFWYRKTLNISPSIEESGSIQWELAVCLILAWLVVYLCILRGTESTGKVGRLLWLIQIIISIINMKWIKTSLGLVLVCHVVVIWVKKKKMQILWPEDYFIGDKTNA